VAKKILSIIFVMIILVGFSEKAYYSVYCGDIEIKGIEYKYGDMPAVRLEKGKKLLINIRIANNDVSLSRIIRIYTTLYSGNRLLDIKASTAEVPSGFDNIYSLVFEPKDSLEDITAGKIKTFIWDGSNFDAIKPIKGYDDYFGKEKEYLGEATESLLSEFEGCILIKAEYPIAFVNNEKMLLKDWNPSIKTIVFNDIIFAPAEFISKSINADYYRNEYLKEITITKDAISINCYEDKSRYFVNGQEFHFTEKPFSSKGITYLPVKKTYEAFGKKVFINKSGLVVISGIEIEGTNYYNILDLIGKRFDELY